MSLGLDSNLNPTNNINESLLLWSELEKVKRENEQLILYKEKMEREKTNFGNLGKIRY